MAANLYTYNHDGKKFSIPVFSSLPMGAIRKARKGENEGDQVFILLETALGEDSKELAIIDSMNASEFEKFLSEWTGGAPLGESLGS